MKLCLFLPGTAIMHASAQGVPRATRVQQARDRDPSVRNFAAYVPVEDVVPKLRRWRDQGAEIVYLSSQRTAGGVAADRSVLERHGFPAGRVLSRGPCQNYGDVVAGEAPDVLIEDDCESIGAEHIAYAQLSAAVRSRVTSIVVREFAGFTDLPDSLDALGASGR
jgi:hypothetical protein